MPIHLQTKLLSVIEDKKVRRLGSEKVKIVNVRLIAATNVNPKEAIEKGKLRNDLFYRLSVICIDLPPLRERLEDLDLLCNWFIKKFAPNRNLTIEDKEIETLKQYSWLGNIRELSNIIERCIILQSGPYLYPSELITNLTKTYQPSPTNNEHILTLQDLEKNHISKIFYRLEKNQTRTAKALNISLNTLKRKLKIYQIA
jgi:transcriptional regulator with PAS, ATPase and Fis domain